MSPDCLRQLEISNTAKVNVGDHVSPKSLRLAVSRIACLVVLGVLCLASGCAALKPMNGIPARYMPNEFKPTTRSGKKTINPSLLGQRRPPHYLLDAGDVLAIYIEGVLGDRKLQQPPVHFPQNQEVAPSFGFPIPVRDDGTISLPMSQPLNVRGMTVRQVEDAIRKRLTLDRQVLKPGRERILVSLQRPRSYKVLVYRQEAGVIDVTQGGQGQVNPGASKRGTGQLVALPAYQNDVLHALAQTGGLPGTDAENTIYIIRGRTPRNNIPRQITSLGRGSQSQHRFKNQSIQQVSSVTVSQYQPPSAPLPPNESTSFGGHSSEVVSNGPMRPQADPVSAYSNFGHSSRGGNRSDWSSTLQNPTVNGSDVIRIPVRLAAGEYPQFSEQDVILQDGDIVFIESRETEIFYTGGLLGGGQYTLPRDYDLDILGAISIAESSQVGGASGGGRQTGGVSALNQDVTIGASNAIILRRLPNNKQVAIKVNLYKALRNPEERILIQPGDYVMLQYTKWEASWAFMERHLLEGALFGLATSQLLTTGTGN